MKNAAQPAATAQGQASRGATRTYAHDERDHRDDAEDHAGRRVGSEVRPLVDREHEQDRARDRRQPADDAADPYAVASGDERGSDDEARREQQLQRDNRQALGSQFALT